MSKVEKALRSLNQTRKSLSAEDSYLEQPGQLLDKALAKQIAVREAELDSLAATNKKNVSVIVRCSTPDPEATCSKNNPTSHFPDQDKVPEDFSIPLNYFLESSEDPVAPPLPPRHPVFPNKTPRVHPTAPEVPWTPPRHNLNVKPRGETSLLEGFRSPRTSALLEPLICLKTKEQPQRMADLDRMKDECCGKLEVFESLLRRHDPSGVDPKTVQESYLRWDEKISDALDSLVRSIGVMTIKHKSAMGTEGINEWKNHVVESEKKYRDYYAATYEVVKSTSAQAAPTPAVSIPLSAPAQETPTPSSRIKTAEVEITIDAERVAEEGKELDNEIKEYDDWGDATNEEIEEAMRNVEEWKKRLSKIQERIYSMKKNAQLFDLNSVEVTKSVSIMENLKEEMNIAIRDIREQDEVRGLYSLSKSKASDVKLPRFGGKPHENFAKFKVEMLKGFKSNKVRKEDQVKKLRENLFDQPKTMIPYSMESITDAWKILDGLR